ncbi:class I SAM-dependent methyltransferase [uncultured Fibrobacter sp.]|uniref:class I SAM-dependent methyltransferase n=1 Tax=uncultured Fibrobacter sp. TaxID=261512 RepID=UPI0025CBCE48|nr:class I SAM-dependent methyltransferase [uncultured Fibrobacter sp.]
MSKNIWNFFAPVYEFSMRVQKDIYSYLYERIGEVAKGKVVLELATGPGMIARHIAPAAKSVVATDLAPKMIETALKAKNPENLSFEVADATSLRFEDNSFDVVVIANALHIIPNPEKVLAEIRRVLKDDGLLIAPNYLLNVGGMKNLWKKILNLIGIRFAHEWTANEFKAFLESNGWSIKMDRVIEGRIDLIYVECKRSSVS